MLFIICLFVASGVTSATEASDKSRPEGSSHCFKKVSEGERLVAYDVTRIVERDSLGGCEEECNIYKCTFFSFGNVSGGNGTCELTTGRQTSRRQDPNFELYERTDECVRGKPTGYEQACYRRILTGRRLHERFIRHSLPCNSLEACQHQCSIEKHFDCQGFNIRLDPARVGRGICELSSIAAVYLDPSRDFVYDPEFVYYERDRNNGSPNCGRFGQAPEAVPPHNPEENAIGYDPSVIGGPYYGGDSYGPWSTGHGTVDHGPWGSHGYGSGFYESNNPSRGPIPAFHPNTPSPQGPYGYAGGRPYPDFRGRPVRPPWDHGAPPGHPSDDGRRDRPNRVPTYIIIDADAIRGDRGDPHPQRPGQGYLPPRPALPPPRPLPPPPRPPPPPPLPPPSYGPPRYFPPGGPDKSFGVSRNIIGREVCFRREHPGHKLNPSTIRGMYETSTVLDCEAMCADSPFQCTGYSFRYSSPGRGEPNCLLTDFASLSPESHLLPDRSCDVYFKMSTCVELDRIGDTECFLKVASNRKIDPSKLVKMLTVSGMSECELSCLGSEFFTCRSFSFRHGPPVIGEPLENCFLSDWPVSALTHFDFVPRANHEVYERGSFGHGCELDYGPPRLGPRQPSPAYPNVPQNGPAKGRWTAGETWRHFTVNGWPCRVGTECRLNPEAGFWACEVEGGDREQWDYCCRPKHSCGFSRGFHYPWCYVGEAGPDQWRPCSEYYYPEFGNRPPYKPVKGNNPHPVDSYGPLRDARPWNFGPEDYGPPSFWPISYLYAEPPPNETYFWNPEEHHHDFHSIEEHPLEHYHLRLEQVDESPKIKFKPCGHKVAFPRAIIQKLDPKVIPKASDPGERLRMEEKPRIPKAEKPADAHDVLGFSPENQDKERLKNEVEFFPSASPPSGNLSLQVSSGKRESAAAQDSNATVASSNRTKEVIRTVEKIILETPAGGGKPPGEPEKNETLKKAETKHPGTLTFSLLENSHFWN